MRAGICKLTGQHGIFLKSHIIPAALTRKDKSAPFIEAGNGRPPKRTWNSWFDSELVIQRGEKILTEFDTWAIANMRRAKLVWSGWGESTVLEPSMDFSATHQLLEEHDNHLGVHSIQGIDTARLRLFLLSLLWRAAVTKRPEFEEIKLPAGDEQQLRRMLLEGTAEPADFYPITLTQLSTLGPHHNQTPIYRDYHFGPDAERGLPPAKTYRFYFDGLIAIVFLPGYSPDLYEGISAIAVGGKPDRLDVVTVPFEHSFQHENMGKVVLEAHTNWPEKSERLNMAGGNRA
ncbi:hypothetical protein ACUXAV_006741 [Cupriavidus metallidurans]|jgi:hypothetical protein|uniref:Uncharacterized protein n=1 Tax=Cupriavidus metallidurans (strain ATCC 43123 / DSM 2839 / NBRC 102507 / CH34) TaxID=266264 RepID=Q1LRM4_CUPMC|nr:hypothetical protein [Cupriavidus metallidurans]ABF07202.1 conserved hypothetical protein [Cupriavidus metallidurans CH34]AVA32467.1 hypothetical protein C3Z06_01880 [Cupriavidus metallidurans]MDE4916627.1 hypothetical protein [Cupriavidus metallidurans]MDE4922937.1 hypothetical protein [Cupriavidus metallidurans]QGS28451.1 hypothetical protein FOB83_05905 [Cupriavidus metallidurans]